MVYDGWARCPTPCRGARPWASPSSSICCLFLHLQVRLFSVIKYESVIHEFDPCEWFANQLVGLAG